MSQEINENGLQEPIKQKLSDKERGAALSNLAGAYLDATNAAMIRHRDALQATITAWKNLNSIPPPIVHKTWWQRLLRR